MPTRPLNPTGGSAQRFWVSVPDSLIERADRLAEAQGLKSRSEYLRTKLEEVIDADYEALFGKGELTKAS